MINLSTIVILQLKFTSMDVLHRRHVSYYDKIGIEWTQIITVHVKTCNNRPSSNLGPLYPKYKVQELS